MNDLNRSVAHPPARSETPETWGPIMYPVDPMKLGRARAERRITVPVLAAAVGRKPATIERLEASGTTRPVSRALLVKLAGQLKVAPRDLLPPVPAGVTVVGLGEQTPPPPEDVALDRLVVTWQEADSFTGEKKVRKLAGAALAAALVRGRREPTEITPRDILDGLEFRLEGLTDVLVALGQVNLEMIPANASAIFTLLSGVTLGLRADCTRPEDISEALASGRVAVQPEAEQGSGEQTGGAR